jgi:hypothetical protein
MLTKKKLGVVIVDTYADKRSARFAVERTLRELHVSECLVLSDVPFVAGARHVPIDTLNGIRDYNALVLDRLCDWAECDAYLVVQWDGFSLDGRRWRDSFLDCDYVGAPWPHLGGLVGSGGFSLRSRKLIESVGRLRRRESRSDVDTAEDVQICITYRRGLTDAGLRFAEPDLAATFSFERYPGSPQLVSPRTFGFHGVFNFPLVLDEAEVLGQFDAMLPRMGRTAAIWYLFVQHAWRRGFEELGLRALTALAERDGTVWARVAQPLLKEGLPKHWLRGQG